MTESAGQVVAQTPPAPSGATKASRAHFHKGSARMFKSDFFEWFSHVHPATPAVMYLPVVGLSLYWELARRGMAVGSAVAFFVVGYVLWTLFEYWFHRLFFHLRVRGALSQRIYFFVHGVHHDYPWDTTRLVMPPSLSLSIAVVIYPLFRWAWGADLMYAPFAGFVLGYVIYDTVHWYAHVGKPKRGFGKLLRREHLVHHFKDSTSRFGVSCPWLDWVFGTRGTPIEAEGAGWSAASGPGAPAATS